MAFIQREFLKEYGEQPRILFFEDEEQFEINEQFLWNDIEGAKQWREIDADLDERIHFRCNALLANCVDAVAQQHDISRGDLVRRLIFIGLAKLEGELLEDTDQLQLGGVGGSAPYGSTEAQTATPTSWTNAGKLSPGSKHPHEHQNRKAS